MRQVSGCIHVFDVKRSTGASACMAVCRLDTTEIGIVVKTDSYTHRIVYISHTAGTVMNQPVFTTLGCSKLCWCLLHQHIRPTSHIVLSQKQLWHLATRCRYVEHVEEYCQLFHPWFGGRCCSVLSRCRPTVLCMSHNARYRPTLTPFNRPSSTIHVDSLVMSQAKQFPVLQPPYMYIGMARNLY